eukprot:CAMPEP_0114308488 /NCGR_PEP_ID=MMETSP0059-20121206/18089_1 /TAXON_ID=36894 /ORGANISM="Pyramimonas parkeae, Strain CCMP726" /LENGTH=249 /DNA_ID=CAMNT_0001432141 /DNA_START=36 /DNA_END=785 /DNA_ORIENTATION=-
MESQQLLGFKGKAVHTHMHHVYTQYLNLAPLTIFLKAKFSGIQHKLEIRKTLLEQQARMNAQAANMSTNCLGFRGIGPKVNPDGRNQAWDFHFYGPMSRGLYGNCGFAHTKCSNNTLRSQIEPWIRQNTSTGLFELLSPGPESLSQEAVQVVNSHFRRQNELCSLFLAVSSQPKCVTWHAYFKSSFVVSRKRILARPRQFYLHAETALGSAKDPMTLLYYERVWNVVFDCWLPESMVEIDGVKECRDTC